MRALMLALLAVAACGGDDGGNVIRVDALSPQDVLQRCQITKIQGDPAMECLIVWACPDEGAFTLACGLDQNSMPGCACVRGEDNVERIVNMAPTSCTDVATVTTFAREQCMWSLQ